MSVITRQGTSGCAVANLIAHAWRRFADDLYPVKAPRSAAVRRCRSASGRPERSARSCRSRPRRPRDAHGCLSQGDGLCQDPVPNARLQAARRGHVHMTSDDLLNVKRKTAEVEQRGVRTRSYQEIHVTRLDRFPASYRTEYTHSRKPRRDAAARICPEPPEGPESGDRSCCGGPGTTSPFPVPHATRVLAHFTEPEVGTFASRHAGLASWRQHALFSPAYLGEPRKQPAQSFPPYALARQTVRQLLYVTRRL